MKKTGSILTEVLSMRVSKEEKLMLRDLQKKYYLDVFRFIRDVIKTEYFKRTNENKK